MAVRVDLLQWTEGDQKSCVEKRDNPLRLCWDEVPAVGLSIIMEGCARS